MPRKLTIALDFDGTLSAYLKRREWHEQLVFDDRYDFPLPGALEWVMNLQDHFHVVISTCRALAPGGKEAVETWLARWGFPPLEVTGEKPVAHVYLDDRAWPYAGGAYPSVEELQAFVPWNRRPT